MTGDTRGGINAPSFPPNFNRPIYCVLGLIIDAVTPDQAIDRIAASIREHKRCLFVTPNMSFLTASRVDRSFWDSMMRNDLSIADGAPLVWLSRLLGLPIQRVPGSNLFESILAGAAGPLTFFFFGGSEGTARTACERINSADRDVRCSGYAFPGFSSVDDMSGASTIEEINDAGADILTVSVGVRKGQLWIMRNERRLLNPVIWYGGAAVNFAAGTVKRAPKIFSQLGFEWVWRIKEEPVLWRRYLDDMKTLVQLLTLRAIPCAIYQIIRRPGDRDFESARLEVTKDQCRHTLGFWGPWTERNLGEVRSALQQAVHDESDLVLDFENITYCDAAFLGLIMLAYGYQSRAGRRFSFCSVGNTARILLWLHGCDFLMDVQDRFVKGSSSGELSAS